MSKVQGDRFRLPEELGGQSSQTNFVKVGASMSKQQKRKRSPETLRYGPQRHHRAHQQGTSKIELGRTRQWADWYARTCQGQMREIEALRGEFPPCQSPDISCSN
jgi:hypothetical protein